MLCFHFIEELQYFSVGWSGYQPISFLTCRVCSWSQNSFLRLLKYVHGSWLMYFCQRSYMWPILQNPWHCLKVFHSQMLTKFPLCRLHVLINSTQQNPFWSASVPEWPSFMDVWKYVSNNLCPSHYEYDWIEKQLNTIFSYRSNTNDSAFPDHRFHSTRKLPNTYVG